MAQGTVAATDRPRAAFACVGDVVPASRPPLLDHRKRDAIADAQSVKREVPSDPPLRTNDGRLCQRRRRPTRRAALRIRVLSNCNGRHPL